MQVQLFHQLKGTAMPLVGWESDERKTSKPNIDKFFNSRVWGKKGKSDSFGWNESFSEEPLCPHFSVYAFLSIFKVIVNVL